MQSMMSKIPYVKYILFKIVTDLMYELLVDSEKLKRFVVDIHHDAIWKFAKNNVSWYKEERARPKPIDGIRENTLDLSKFYVALEYFKYAALLGIKVDSEVKLELFPNSKDESKGETKCVTMSAKKFRLYFDTSEEENTNEKLNAEICHAVMSSQSQIWNDYKTRSFLMNPSAVPVRPIAFGVFQETVEYYFWLLNFPERNQIDGITLEYIIRNEYVPDTMLLEFKLYMNDFMQPIGVKDVSKYYHIPSFYLASDLLLHKQDSAKDDSVKDDLAIENIKKLQWMIRQPIRIPTDNELKNLSEMRRKYEALQKPYMEEKRALGQFNADAYEAYLEKYLKLNEKYGSPTKELADWILEKMPYQGKDGHKYPSQVCYVWTMFGKANADELLTELPDELKPVSPDKIAQ